MRLAIVGLGRMGMNMARRLLQGGHEVVAFNRSPDKTDRLGEEGAIGAYSLPQVVEKLSSPRVVWMMLPAGEIIDEHLDQLQELLGPGDIVIDGANTYYKDDMRRSKSFAERGIHFLDAGVSGGIWGLKVGYCLMIGGEKAIYEKLLSVFETLAPARLSLLWSCRRRAFCENGSQRYRVWHDAGLRGRISAAGGFSLCVQLELRGRCPPLEPRKRRPIVAAGARRGCLQRGPEAG